MMTLLIYALGVYLGCCWLWGVYMAVRLYTGRRMRRIMRGESSRRRALRPITTNQSVETEQPVSPRTAETLAESRAA